LSVLDLAKKIIELSGSSSEIVLLPRTPDDPERRRPDLTLAKARLGYEPKVGPEEGLRATIDYFRAL
jgi:dTDP-glucose 4,6-dehydratase